MPGRKRSLQPGDTRPLATQLAQALADEIARGVYREGDRVPGARMLAEKWSVSDRTAHDAIAILVSNSVLRKGVRTQPAVVAATRAQAAKVRDELEKFEARSDTERINDLEARMRRIEAASESGGDAAAVARLREDLAGVLKYAETVEARVLAIERREKDQAEAGAEER